MPIGWDEGSGFRVVGRVFKTFVAQSGKFGKLIVDVNMSPHPAKIEFKSFDTIVIGDISRLEKGKLIQVRGKIENEKLTDRNRDAVKVDGYDVWVSVLRPSSIETESTVQSPAGIAAPSGESEQPSPFGSTGAPTPERGSQFGGGGTFGR